QACGRYRCNVAGGRCFQQCDAYGSYCSAGNVCSVVGACVPDMCTQISANGGCPGHFLCVQGACPSSCFADDQCDLGFKCAGGFCVGSRDAGTPIEAATSDAS